MLPIRFGGVTGELDDDLERALAIARDLGIGAVELNQLWGRGFVELPETEIARAERLLGAAGSNIVAIDSPCFKPCVLDHLRAGRVGEDPEVARHLALLDRALELARRFSPPFVRGFSLRRSGIVGPGNPSPRPPDGGPVPQGRLDPIPRGLPEAAPPPEEA